MKIQRVNAERQRAVITSLHKQTFPSDRMCALEGDWWLVFDGPTPVAFAAMRPSIQWAGTTYLSRCGVLPSHTGRGIQRHLIRVRETRARRLGQTWLITDTRRNPASANSLIKAGFRMYEPQEPWSFNDALYWRKRINNLGQRCQHRN